MPSIEYKAYRIEPINLSRFKELPDESLESIIDPILVSSAFISNEDFVELSYFTLDNVRLQTVGDYRNYSIVTGDKLTDAVGNAEISVDPIEDYKTFYGTTGEVKALYNFLRDPFLTNGLRQQFYFESISSDRKEARLLPINLEPDRVVQVADKLNLRFFEEIYNINLHLYPNFNEFHSIVNADTRVFRGTPSLILKFAEPLPSSYTVNSKTYIVEKISDSVAFEIETRVTVEEEEVPTLRGANFDVQVEEQTTEPSQYYNYNELFSFPTNNTYRELNSLFNEKGAQLGIDYSNFSNFINFSSAEERLRNFKYKLDLINSYQSSLDAINTSTYSSTGISGSRGYYETLINGVVNNFDHFERHLYFESGSTSWPKTNPTPAGANKPYTNMASSEDLATTFYNNEIQQAIIYDSKNPDILTNTIPAFLKEDSNNEPYELFIHMIAQHFDNLWLYTDAVSKKYDADNRLNRGVSKDLVEDLLKNFGIKLYTSTKSAEDLFRYFTVNSYDSSDEFLPSGITKSGEEPLSQNDYQKEIYKRIYHNLPILLKSKGTERGLRALINCFGVPSDILKIKVFGGQSVNDLPYFGGEQALSTGSFDKVRLDNTGSIATGDTISFYTSIINQDSKYTQDLHRVEVGFSPADNIDNYIVSQSAVLFPNDPFNIDQYIGDPRGYETNKYLELYNYAKNILADVNEYNVKDFVRLIKFFDNVLFRMVRDFIPARAVTDAGIIIKPHLLDRNKTEKAAMTWTRPEYSGSIKIGRMSGSNAGAFKNIGSGSVSVGDSLILDREHRTNYRQLVKTPIGVRYKVLTANSGSSEEQITKNFNEAKFDGEFKNSGIRITNGELNVENPYKQIDYPEIKYDVQYWQNIPPDLCILTVPSTEYIITNQDQDLNLANSSIFTGDTPLYTFLVDGNEPNVNNFTHNFGSAEQYETFDITARHPNHPNILNSASGETGCEETRLARVVNCFLGSATGVIPPRATIDLPFNLINIFFNLEDSQDPGNFNSNITYFINNTEVGSSVNGVVDVNNSNYNSNNPVDAYIFPSDYTGNQIELVAQDTFSTGCKTTLVLPFNACPLLDPTFLEPDRFVTTTAAIPVVMNHFVAPFVFIGANTTTLFEFRLKVVHTYRNNAQNEITAEYLSNYAPISVPDWNGFEGLSNVQHQYFDIVNNTDGTGPSITWLNLAGPPAVEAQGANVEENFRRYIQFKATSSETCDATSRWYEFSKDSLTKREVKLLYYDIGNQSDYHLGIICSIQQEVSVYVYLPSSVQTPEPAQVITQPSSYLIYANGNEAGDNVNEPAPAGLYGAFNEESGYNRGRKWAVTTLEGGSSVGSWDQETNFDPNYGGNEGIDYNVVNGKVICGDVGTDGPTGVVGDVTDPIAEVDTGVFDHIPNVGTYGN